MGSLWVLVALSLLFLYIWKIWKLLLTTLQLKGPFVLPLLGNSLEFLGSTEDFLQTLTRLVERYNAPFRVWIGTKFMVVLTKPEDIEIILNNPKSIRKSDHYKFLTPVTGESIIVQKDIPQWRQRRKLLSPSFNYKILDNSVSIIEEHSLVLCKKLEEMVEKTDFDVVPFIQPCTLDIIFETILSTKVNFQLTDNKEYGKWVDSVCTLSYKRFFNVWKQLDFIYKYTKDGKLFAKHGQYLRNFNDEIINRKLREYVKRKEHHTFPEIKRFIDIIIEASQEQGCFSKEQICDEVTTFIIAGGHSSTGTTAFTMMMLGMHPEIQDKVYEELCEIFGDSDRAITNDDVHKMKYLERVIKETLRLFPFAIIIARTVSEDLKLDTCTLPEGCYSIISIYHIHRDPNIWPNPLNFNPDRFLLEELEKRHYYSWIPFSGGPRNCIGLKLAMLSIKVIIATILRKYKVSCKYQNIEEIKLKPDFALKPIDGYYISLKFRN